MTWTDSTPEADAGTKDGTWRLTEVFPGVMLADEVSARAAALSDACPFTAALCVHCDDPEDWPDSDGEFLHIPLIDGDLCPPNAFRHAAQALRGFLARHRRTVVYCQAGVSRSASVIAACAACHMPAVLDACAGERADRPLRADFALYHSWVNSEDDCAAAGFPPEFLGEPAFRRCLLAFETMAKVAPQVFMSPHLWRAVYPEVRSMFAPMP
jgi:hypothetical protein